MLRDIPLSSFAFFFFLVQSQSQLEDSMDRCFVSVADLVFSRFTWGTEMTCKSYSHPVPNSA